MKRKTIIMLLMIYLVLSPVYPAEPHEQEPSLYPDFYFPHDTPFFNLWANPALLEHNESIRFHSSLYSGIYSSLSTLGEVINGDYPLIAYWVDQFSAGGYGASLCTDNGIEAKYWSAGIYMTFNTFTKGPVFPQVSYGNCTFTTALYTGISYPFRLDDLNFSIGATVMPLYRLKVPMTTEFYRALFTNIIEWEQSRLRDLFNDIPLYQGIGFGINSSLMLEYKDITALLVVDNLFNTHIWYKQFALGRFLENPGILFTENDKPVDHVGVIPMDISLSGTYSISMPYRVVQNLELGYGIYQLITAITTETTTYVDTLSLSGTIQFFSFLHLKTALYGGSFYLNLSCIFSSWELDISLFTAMNNREDYPGPKDAMAIGIHYFQ